MLKEHKLEKTVKQKHYRKHMDMSGKPIAIMDTVETGMLKLCLQKRLLKLQSVVIISGFSLKIFL